MSFYEKLAATADRLIDRFGKEIEITRAPIAMPDPVTGEGFRPGGAYDAKAVLLPYPDRAIDGTRIQAGDRNLLMSVGSAEYEPALSDRPVVNNQEWTIVSIETVNPAGTEILYKLQVRQ